MLGYHRQFVSCLSLWINLTKPPTQDCGFDVDPKRAVPGPGQYNLCSKDRHSVGSGPTSSFLCVRKPLESTEGDVNTPAPGSYELLTPAQVNVDKNGQILEHPCFRSQTSRSASFIAKSEVPGPGEYDTDRSFMGGRMGTTVSVTQGQRGKGASGSGGGGGGRFGRPLPSKEDDSTSPGACCAFVLSLGCRTFPAGD